MGLSHVDYRNSAVVYAAFTLVAAFASPRGSAHTPDTSYANVVFTPNTLRIELAFDLQTLSRIQAIDGDLDGVISEPELRTVENALRRFLRSEIEFEINEYITDLGEFESAVWPRSEANIASVDWNQTVITFPFQRHTAEIPESVTLAFHVFEKLGDRHKVLGAFRQPNKPAYEVIYSIFEPDFLYFTDYAPSWSAQIGTFLRLGIEHIFIGYDHILFLVGLIMGSRFWPLVKIVTSFTLAHTITLCLAATGTISLPSRLIEVCIAGTIVYVAIENLVREESSDRWRLTFAFGLIHGFGFANVLSQLSLPREGLMRCLLAFNGGVELGQLAIVAAVWPLWQLLAKRDFGPSLARCFSVLILACGAAWLVDRITGSQWMPF